MRTKFTTTRLLLVSALLGLQGFSVAAQQKNVDNQALSWLCYFGTYRLTDKLSLWTELQLRRTDFANEWQQVLLRVGINYHYRDNIVFTAGYAYLWTYPYGEQPIALDQPRYEHRPWQQVTLLHSSGEVTFQHRYRLEQRFSRTGHRPTRPLACVPSAKVMSGRTGCGTGSCPPCPSRARQEAKTIRHRL